MSTAERLFLYALARGVRPERVLEIGSRHGGSASILAAALMDNDPKHASRIIGLDPGPEITVKPAMFHGKFELVVAPSPQGIAAARARVDGPFDFVPIDGLHIYSQVRLDLEGVLPHLADRTYILLHDAFHLGIAKAIDEVVTAYDGRLVDCGYPCNRASMSAGAALAYGGFRLLLWLKSGKVDARALIELNAEERGIDAPPDDPDLANHDPYWYCRKVKPCAYCIRNGLNQPKV